MESQLVAVCLQWEESERGWGVRPTDFSLHLTAEDAQIWADIFMKRQDKYFKKVGVKGVPDEYDRPAGKPFACFVTQEQWDALNTPEAKEKHGIGGNPRPWPKAVVPSEASWRSD